MNILFVYKGPKNPIVDAQVTSLVKRGVNVTKFPLKILNPLNYLTEYIRLVRFLNRQKIDLIHAHYSYSGIIAGLTFLKTICSLMGSDVFSQRRLILRLTYFFHKYIWKKTIVKSKAMQKIFPKSTIIPNGVNLEMFRPIDRAEAIKRTSLDQKSKNIIFVVEKYHRNSKNFQLATLACSDYLDGTNTNLVLVTDKNQNELVNYYNAADVLLLTSLSEGSPNTIKEAMACNCPIVSTNVGDVKKVMGDAKGCYITSFDPKNIAEKLEKVLTFAGKTNGRERIKYLKLDAKKTADKIIRVYKKEI